MFNKIKAIIREIINENKRLHHLNYCQLKELEWAHIFHDSIRGKKWLEDQPINIGRWAGNYAFYYVLNRILSDYKPTNIIEFGLGESSKFISIYLDNYLKESKHLIIEQNQEWYDNFTNNFKLSSNTQVKICNVVTKQVNGHETNSYENINQLVDTKFDLYIIDGPIGSKHYSRHDIVDLATRLTKHDDFIIIIDDVNRKGEQETTKDLVETLEKKGVIIYKKKYFGNKSLMLLVTEKFKYATSF
ncbi:hypothetical protein SAMN05428642_1021094 [Flaviramulus basaltis]|uniref:Methyltransferase domain-containing protein n=1 Tax=Flaviramulus basaltis TaxID=369401 RepID=A0A1K2IKQ2_9FLAO|nr:hypothetical protein [Flaviramulus basaltis]SFZ92951.1 hypothetical protein SAMN05428642_1021094 [Flaviramulus basaltis]